MRSQVVTLGADIEGFLLDGNTGNFIPCVGLVPGTKAKPHQVPDMKPGFCVQEDNVMIEWNIPPQTTVNGFRQAIKAGRSMLSKVLPPNVQVMYTDAVMFNPDQLESKQAKTFGCDPDFDAYQGGAVRHAPANLMDPLWRGAGGHIHIGGDFQCPDFVVALFCDLFLSVSIGTNQGQTHRTNWYGKPGIFRPKEYGIEYRTPGSYWVGNSDYVGYIATSVHRMAKWLVETDAAELQAVFSKINWRRVHNYLTYGPITTGSRSRERNAIIHEAKQAGAPL